MKNFYSFLLARASTVFAACFSIVFALILIFVIIMLWWTEIKQKSVKEFFVAIKTKIVKIFKKLTEEKPVKTVYLDKARNFSGTEFLPIPAKAPTSEFSYEFVGWDKNYVDENGNTVARPIFIQKVNSLSINVYDDDKETLIKNFEIEYGAGIDLSDVKLEKPASKEFFYEFVGWDKDITNFYKNENVYAVYRAIPKKFTYTFFDRDGSSILSQTTAIYGTPIIPPEPPHTDDISEQFSHWRGFEDNMILTHDVNFVAIFKKTGDETLNTNSENEKIKQSNLSFNFDMEARNLKESEKKPEREEKKTEPETQEKKEKEGFKLFSLFGSKNKTKENEAEKIQNENSSDVKADETKIDAQDEAEQDESLETQNSEQNETEQNESLETQKPEQNETEQDDKNESDDEDKKTEKHEDLDKNSENKKERKFKWFSKKNKVQKLELGSNEKTAEEIVQNVKFIGKRK